VSVKTRRTATLCNKIADLEATAEHGVLKLRATAEFWESLLEDTQTLGQQVKKDVDKAQKKLDKEKKDAAAAELASKALIRALGANGSLTSLNLINFSPTFIRDLAKLMSANTALISLSIDGIKTTDRMTSAFTLRGRMQKNSVKSWDGPSDLTDAFSNMLRSNTTLRSLAMIHGGDEGNVYFTCTSAQAKLASGIAANTTLTSLRWESVLSTTCGLQRCCQHTNCKKQCCRFRTGNLFPHFEEFMDRTQGEWCKAGVRVVSSTSLIYCCTLLSIALLYYTAGVEALIASIRSNTRLRDLSLGSPYHEIGQCCQDLVIDAVLSNTNLTRLHLFGLSDSGGRSLARILAHTSLTSLSLVKANDHILFKGAGDDDEIESHAEPDHTIGDASASEFALHLLRNTSLTVLNLPNNSISFRSARKLSDALKVNRTLRSLNLSSQWKKEWFGKEEDEDEDLEIGHNPLTPIHAQVDPTTVLAESILDFLPLNSTLTELNLEGLGMTAAARQLLVGNIRMHAHAHTHTHTCLGNKT